MCEVHEHRERLALARQGLRDFNARYNWSIMEQRYLDLVHGLTEG